jgi:methyltransferase (TIGR00027 family)
MEAGQPSRSAMGSGLLRAAHVREDRPPWVFEDALAARLLNAEETEELEASMAAWAPEVRRAFRLSHAVRARLAEDVAIAGLAAGRRDYVLLGAGLDTFAWRHPRAGEFTVWEVDHPSTQAWKRAALSRSGTVALAEPANVRFVPADLAETAVGDLGLPGRATWNWLGVTMYLEPQATRAVLRAIAAGSPGTTLVVNFLLAAGTLDALARAVRDSSVAAVAAAGEPVVATYTQDQASNLLRTAGFGQVELFDAAALRARYLPGRPDLELPGSTVIAVATVLATVPGAPGTTIRVK